MIEAERVLAALARAVPATAPVTAIEPILQGWGNESWIVETALGRLVVKVGLPAADVAKWRAAVAGAALARSAGVPAPTLLAFVDAMDEIDGRILRVFRYIPGSTPRVDAPERVFRDLGTVVRRLHAVTPPHFSSRVGGEGFARWSAFLEHRWSAVADRAAAADIDAELVAGARSVGISLARAVDDAVAPALCHRDLYVDNVLVGEDGALVALLDFDMVEVWDPVVDFFKLEWFVFEPNPTARAPFLDAYLDGDPLPRMFAERLALASLIELVNHAANWRVGGQPDIANEALARLRKVVLFASSG